ncbi:hypothetical protein IFM89_017117 [Coptis chinensis]|uniref:Uncharacterized protein n=1 Tax=Coptis chinensis TaxID=261450 RepID=A0A835HKI3_9MAGN|nr:hypothetical protein IFM89_017117 [Coptis chinensis]
MGKSQLYCNGAHANKVELIMRGEFKQILADKGEEMYMKMKQRGKDVDNGENHETLAGMKRKPEKKGVAHLGSHSTLSQPNEAELMADINIDNWKKVPDETKDLLWTVTKKFQNINISALGYLWRSSKSRFSMIMASCANDEERMKKRPKNIKLEWWKSFVRRGSPKNFNMKFKKMRAKQNRPHTCSRKGYARLDAEMKEESSNPSSVSRADVWEKAHTKKNGELANEAVAAKVEKIQEFREIQIESSSLSLQEDVISQLFGPERRG